MSAALEPRETVECTYKDCDLSFPTASLMRRHKKDYHDYCMKCDLDCENPEDYVYHKVLEPDNHLKSCRICGEERHTLSGLKRHIETSHPINQRLKCPGCDLAFRSPHEFIQHVEFGHCDVISASQFQGHVIHKHLIAELLKGGEAFVRFQQKTAKYNAALDHEEVGGVDLGDDVFEDEEIGEVEFKALKPDTPPDTPLSPAATGPFPPLPTQIRTTQCEHEFDIASDLASDLGVSDFEADLASLASGISISSGASETPTVVNSPLASPVASRHFGSSFFPASSRQVLSTVGSTTASSGRQPKAWGSRVGKTASSILFPNAKPTPAPNDFSIESYDNTREKEHGLNIMKTRFWDPMSGDWNPERFFDSVLSKYYCPFTCEQTFTCPADLNKHILGDHRITHMKCPTCLKEFKTAWRLMAHCESRGARCEINKAENYNILLDRLSGGFLEVKDDVRPEFLNNPTRIIQNKETQRMEKYTPPVANYLQYMVTTPPDWKEPVRVAKVIGGILNRTARPVQW